MCYDENLGSLFLPCQAVQEFCLVNSSFCSVIPCKLSFWSENSLFSTPLPVPTEPTQIPQGFSLDYQAKTIPFHRSDYFGWILVWGRSWLPLPEVPQPNPRVTSYPDWLVNSQIGPCHCAALFGVQSRICVVCIVIWIEPVRWERTFKVAQILDPVCWDWEWVSWLGAGPTYLTIEITRLLVPSFSHSDRLSTRDSVPATLVLGQLHTQTSLSPDFGNCSLLGLLLP